MRESLPVRQAGFRLNISNRRGTNKETDRLSGRVRIALSPNHLTIQTKQAFPFSKSFSEPFVISYLTERVIYNEELEALFGAFGEIGSLALARCTRWRGSADILRFDQQAEMIK